MQYNQSSKQKASQKRERLKKCAHAPCVVESLWAWMREEAVSLQKEERTLCGLLQDVVLERDCLEMALAARLSRKLSFRDMPREELEPLILYVFRQNPSALEDVAYDLCAIVERDPACSSPLQALLFFKGFHALTTYRIAHALWKEGREMMAYFFQSISSEVFAVDIHPAARIGHGILLDHATSFVVGETAIVENNVSILHEVTLGGTGKESGDRHPIVRSGVLLGAGAKVLGRVVIGECAKIGAGSVVLDDVAAHTTVAGVPAVVVGVPEESTPADDMLQCLCSKQYPKEGC